MNTRAESLARALDGRKTGAGWTARCPAHEDGTPSLSITQAGARVLVHCFAGCDQARLLAVLRERGLWCANPKVQWRPAAKPKPPTPSVEALSLWRQAHPARGTLVERYLASRGLRLPEGDALRFVPALRHRYARGWWPAMLALVCDGVEGTPRAIHRTWLARDGSGKAPIESPRLSLGPTRGGAVRLAPAGETLLVGEGIETCLSAMQASGLPSWSALSTSGLIALELPPAVRTVIVLADGDDPGEHAARACGQRWRDEGRAVRIARPPRGQDFNDMLLHSLSPRAGRGSG
jgi:putative DNA primase/helicase